jgi:hypothetical protein
MMNKKNYWGDPDEEPLPDWMNPETYRNGGLKKVKAVKTLEEAAAEALKKPPIPIIIKAPNEN